MSDLAVSSPLSSFTSYRRKQALAAIALELHNSSGVSMPAATLPVGEADPVGVCDALQQLTVSTDPLPVFTHLAQLLVPTVCDEAAAAVHLAGELAAGQQPQSVTTDVQVANGHLGGRGWVLTVHTAAHRTASDGEVGGSSYVAVLTCTGRGHGPTGRVVALIDLAARHAAAVVHQARLQQLLQQHQEQARHLKAALEGNRMIGAAVGVLMVTHQLTYQQGFDLLARTSQNTNRKVAAIAETVLHTGALPVNL
jgi:hypothetical protein